MRLPINNDKPRPFLPNTPTQLCTHTKKENDLMKIRNRHLFVLNTASAEKKSNWLNEELKTLIMGHKSNAFT